MSQQTHEEFRGRSCYRALQIGGGGEAEVAVPPPSPTLGARTKLGPAASAVSFAGVNLVTLNDQDAYSMQP